MMLQAAAENTGLRAVVSDGAGFRSVREELLRGPRGWFTSLPEQAVQSAALTVMSGTAPPPSLEDARAANRAAATSSSSTPATAPAARNTTATTTAPPHAPKAIWKISEADHTGGFQARPHEYERRVIGFFDRALLEDKE